MTVFYPQPHVLRVSRALANLWANTMDGMRILKDEKRKSISCKRRMN